MPEHARRVPRRDRADDADRDAADHRQPARLTPSARASRTAGTACVAALRISLTAKFCSWCILPWTAPVSRCVHVAELVAVRLVDLGRAAEDPRPAPGSSSRPRRAGRPRPRRRRARRRPGVEPARPSAAGGRWPARGSSRGSPVPGSPVGQERVEPAGGRSAACGHGVSSRLRWRALGVGRGASARPAGRRVAPDRAAGEDLRRSGPPRCSRGTSRSRASSPPGPGSRAARGRACRCSSRRRSRAAARRGGRLVALERREARRRVVAELRAERRPERLGEVGPGAEHEPQPGVAHDLAGRRHAVGRRDQVVGDRTHHLNWCVFVANGGIKFLRFIT